MTVYFVGIYPLYQKGAFHSYITLYRNNVIFLSHLSFVHDMFSYCRFYQNMVFIGNKTRRQTMAKNTSISLGDHFEGFINEQIMQGRYGSASEVIRASLRLLEEQEQKFQALQQALIEGEKSGDAGELDMEAIKCQFSPL